MESRNLVVSRLQTKQNPLGSLLGEAQPTLVFDEQDGTILSSDLLRRTYLATEGRLLTGSLSESSAAEKFVIQRKAERLWAHLRVAPT